MAISGREASADWTSGERELYTQLYRRMFLIRTFEDRVMSLFLKNEVHGTAHLYNGQEAVAVGVSSVLDPGDRVAGTYRGHGHVIALGAEPQAVMDELLGRATGTNAGRGGSMNILALDHGHIGSFGIVGASMGAAVGAALSLKRSGGVAVAFFGDGAANQAYFHECLNFCAVRKLPAVFVCENNGYGEYSPTERVTAGKIADRPAAMGIPAEVVDGMSVWTVREHAARAAEHARSGAGPYFLEMVTYRFVGHSRTDPGRYRPENELERWLERDPLRVARTRLEEEGVPAEELDSVEADVRREIDEVEQRALAAPWPDVSHAATEFAP
jgi:acetoin:2,6-dichlorophenolindophenol oxidoreductase subunit alpha